MEMASPILPVDGLTRDPRQKFNLFQANDWPVSTFVTAVVSLLVLVVVTDFYPLEFFPFPLIRALVNFTYLTFVPGYLLLRILRIHGITNIEALVFAIAFSLASVMFTGFAMNFFGPMAGLSRPISEIPLVLTLTLGVIGLLISAYVRDGEYFTKIQVDLTGIFSPPVLFLLLLPPLSIIGTYLVNLELNNTVLLILILLIGAVILLAAFERFIPVDLYPLAIWTISIALLYQTSLISPHLTGWDIHGEYHYANLVRLTGSWNPVLRGNPNAMLSIAMLSPIYGILMGTDITWVFKLVVPFIFSLVPVALFEVYFRQLDQHLPGRISSLEEGYDAWRERTRRYRKIAFLSVIFFMSMATFYTEMLSLVRQELAEFFLAAFLVLLVTARVDRNLKEVIGMGLVICMITSHYSLAFIYAVVFPLTLALRWIIEWREGTRDEASIITVLFVEIFLILNLLWHFIIEGSTVYSDVGQRMGDIISRFATILFQFSESPQMRIMEQGLFTPLHAVSKYLSMLSLLLIFLGIATLILHTVFPRWRSELPFTAEFRAFSIASFLIFFSSFIIPNIFMINVSRVYHIVLFFLAPYCIIGCFQVLQFFTRWSRLRRFSDQEIWIQAFAVFFTAMFFIGSGLVYEVAREYPTSISLSQKTILSGGNLTSIIRLHSNWIPETDVAAVQWASARRNSSFRVYADGTITSLPMYSYGMNLENSYLMNDTWPEYGSYILLSRLNTRYGVMTWPDSNVTNTWPTSALDPILADRGRIYSNGGAEIWR